jgi:hypothetical protein
LQSRRPISPPDPFLILVRSFACIANTTLSGGGIDFVGESFFAGIYLQPYQWRRILIGMVVYIPASVPYDSPAVPFCREDVGENMLFTPPPQASKDTKSSTRFYSKGRESSANNI